MLFSLAVTELDASVQPLVVRQVMMPARRRFPESTCSSGDDRTPPHFLPHDLPSPRQTERLDADGWLELLSLVKDANPVSGKVHTFPRSLGPLFAERFLARYLRDDPTLPPRHPHRAARDARYYLLFVACTPPAGVARYVLGMLAGQRHELDDMLLGSLADRMSGAEFREVIEYIQPSAWPSRLQWALTCVAERGEASRCRERPRAPELSRD